MARGFFMIFNLVADVKRAVRDLGRARVVESRQCARKSTDEALARIGGDIGIEGGSGMIGIKLFIAVHQIEKIDGFSSRRVLLEIEFDRFAVVALYGSNHVQIDISIIGFDYRDGFDNKFVENKSGPINGRVEKAWWRRRHYESLVFIRRTRKEKQRGKHRK